MKKSEGTQEVKQFYDQDDIVQQKFLISDDDEQWVVVEHNNETLSMSLHNWQKLVEFANIIISKHNTDEQDETEHLLSTETNKRRLLESIKQQEIMKQTVLEQLRDEDLEYYETLSYNAVNFRNSVPRAINFYYDYKQMNLFQRIMLAFKNKNKL